MIKQWQSATDDKHRGSQQLKKQWQSANDDKGMAVIN